MIREILKNTAELLTTDWKHTTVIGWYNENSAPHELNILTRFASAASNIMKDATAFYEVMIDNGRIDLVIISPEAILLVEGKTTFHGNTSSLIKTLNAQVDRIHGENAGVRKLVDKRIADYCAERWSLQSPPPIYVVALSWCNPRGLNAWSSHEKWSPSLSSFNSGSEQFLFSNDPHFLLYKYKESNGPTRV
jgi:hypothetical protein